MVEGFRRCSRRQRLPTRGRDVGRIPPYFFPDGPGTGITIEPPGPRILEELMRSLAQKVQRFLVSEDGPTAVEYAVMLALIIIVCLTAISSLGTATSAQFDAITAELEAGVGSGSGS